MSKQSNKYARNRRFKYPNYRSVSNLGEEDSSDGYESDYHNRRSPGYVENICDKNTMQQNSQRDPYAILAEQAFVQGNYNAALNAWGQSFTKYRNIESIKTIGELFCKSFVEKYQECGYDGRDSEGMALVEGAISMFVAYESLGGDSSSTEESINCISSCFYNINDFAALHAKVKAKCRDIDFTTFVNQFYKRGY